MAIEISNGTSVPHATDYSDLLSKLKTFATAHGWTSMEDTSDKLVLKGEGSGSDQIFVAFQKYSDVPNDSYGWRLNGYTAYSGSSFDFTHQPGAIQASQQNAKGYPAIPLWNSTIPYWFIVSGRRIIVIAKVSTTYQMAYLGWYLPFATPNQYPYPLAVGGSYMTSSTDNKPRWSGSTSLSSAFWSGLGSGVTSLFIRHTEGAWRSHFNSVSGTTHSTGMFPYNQADINLVRQAVDDSPVLTPIEIDFDATTSLGRIGELDGVYHVAGFGQTAENVVTIGGTDYVVIPDVFRSGNSNYCAVKLA